MRRRNQLMLSGLAFEIQGHDADVERRKLKELMREGFYAS